MDSSNIKVHLKIRRYDNSVTPVVIDKTVEFDSKTEYNKLKKDFQDICQIGPDDNRVIKLRRHDEVLVPLSFILDPQENPENGYFYIDVCKINYIHKSTASLLQDAYIDSVCQKLCNMESRVIKAEMLLPQLEWTRQSHMEETVSTLANRVSFLNRRVDELLPAKWRSKMPQTMA